jgi:hypothetical protein
MRDDGEQCFHMIWKAGTTGRSLLPAQIPVGWRYLPLTSQKSITACDRMYRVREYRGEEWKAKL